MLCVSNQLFCVHNICYNNENNMSDGNTDDPYLKYTCGNHVCKGRKLAELLKIRCANG